MHVSMYICINVFAERYTADQDARKSKRHDSPHETDAVMCEKIWPGNTKEGCGEGHVQGRDRETQNHISQHGAMRCVHTPMRKRHTLTDFGLRSCAWGFSFGLESQSALKRHVAKSSIKTGPGPKHRLEKLTTRATQD